MNIALKRTTKLAVSAAAALVLSAGLSLESHAAGSANANLAISAEVANNCTISASSAVSFGTFDTLTGSALNGAGALSVACTNGASASVTLNEGSNPASGSSTSAPLRQMLFNNGTDHFLSYNLYTDSGRGTVWGDTGVAATADGTAHSIDVFGKIDGSQQSAIAGSYADTVVATVSF